MRILKANTHVFSGDDFPVLVVNFECSNTIKTIIIRHEVLAALWETGLDSSANDVRFASPFVIKKILDDRVVLIETPLEDDHEQDLS